MVRYADTGGFEADLLYPQAWRFRDYVIRSLNADKPFDRFAREQVAGDELWPDEPEAVLGSTLYSVGPALVDSAMVTGQLEYEWLTDAADTTGEVFLGLTFGCARCHDHKYDPIHQRDYFAMQAIFAASDRSYPDKVRLNRIKALNGMLSEVPVPKELLDDPRCTVKDEDRQGFRLFHRAEPLVIHRLHRGELNKPQEVVEPGLPVAVSTASDRAELARTSPTNRRAALARWLTSPGNPLVARVLVNRVWGWHFGQGIVRHAQRFRRPGRGADPSGAARLAGQRPDRTRLEPQATAPADRALQHLPDGERAGRGRSPRRPGEPPALAIPSPTPGGRGDPGRDARLLGPAQLREFGTPVVPPLGKDELTGLFDAREKWPVTQDAAEHDRRSVYLLVRRTFAYPMFSSFDPPELMTSCPRRMQTIVPAQALAMLNSPLAREQAAAFAGRVVRGAGPPRERPSLAPGCWPSAGRSPSQKPGAPWSSSRSGRPPSPGGWRGRIRRRESGRAEKESPSRKPWPNCAWPCSTPTSSSPWIEGGDAVAADLADTIPRPETRALPP